MKQKNRFFISSLILIGFVMAFASSCIKDKDNDIIPSTLEIGQNYQGGIIAYILQPEDLGYVLGETHGLIAAPSDQSTGVIWHATEMTITGATGTTIGTGSANTNAVIAVFGTENNAARICYDLALGGYSDWYLPSRDELNKLYLNRVVIGGFSNVIYWSSSELSAGGYAFSQDFLNGNQIGYDMDGSNFYNVRSVRSF